MSDNDEFEIIDIGLSSEQFYKMLGNMKTSEFKFFQKEYKEYTHKDITCQSYVNDETKVFKRKHLSLQKYDEYVLFKSMRQKLTLLNFPSTKNLQQVMYVKKLIFRVSNRIYINFQISIDMNQQQKCYAVYINYNHEENVDVQLVNKSLGDIITILLQ